MTHTTQSVLKEGGDWLAATRNWIQFNTVNGCGVTWGTAEPLRPTMTVKQAEELAAAAVAADRNFRKSILITESCIANSPTICRKTLRALLAGMIMGGLAAREFLEVGERSARMSIDGADVLLSKLENLDSVKGES